MSYNFKSHARMRALERSSNFRRIKDIESYDWKRVRYVDRFEKYDFEKLIYCEELELLGIIERGKKVRTVISLDSSEMELVDGKFERQERNRSRNYVSFKPEVEQDLQDRRFEV